MLFRFFVFVLVLLAGALAGWALAAQAGALLGLASSSLAWFGIDMLRGARVLRWLRHAEVADDIALKGLWGEVVDRARRAMKTRDLRTEQSERRLLDFLAAIQASPNGVVLLDPLGRIEWCNQTAAAQLGIDADRDLLQLVGNLVRDPDFAAYDAAGDFSRDIVIQGRQGTVARPLRLSVQLHSYGDGRKLLLTRDITAVEQADTMRRDFVANVSHEIRTPLTVLTGFVQTMQQLELTAPERTRYLGLMAQQSDRMQTLVSDLLTLSRLEGSPLPHVGEWTPVAVLLEQCEQEARALCVALGKAQELRFAPAPQTELAGAHGEILSAISNLVSNAVRYTPAGGAIEVAWQALPDGRAVFSVRDSGPGIAPEHLPRLTERFYRVDRSRSRDTGGTGLGLAIVKHVVQRHGAELQIESKPGLGSTFSIVFPASRLRRRFKEQTGLPAPPATESPAG